MYAAEIDGVWLEEGSDMNPKLHPELLEQCRLVELKTTKIFEQGKMTHNFRRFVACNIQIERTKRKLLDESININS